MPGKRCAVAICNNNLVKAREEGKAISFHHFPDDERRRKEWIIKCRRADKTFNPKNAYICSEHFLPTDFERNLQSELLGTTSRKILKHTAVPSVNLSVPKYVQSEPGPSSSRQARQEKRNIKSLLTDLLKSIPCEKEVQENYSVEEKQEPEDLESKYETIRKENLDLKRRLEESCEQANGLQSRVQELENKLERIISAKSDNIESAIYEIFQTVFTQKQLDVIVKKKKRVVWSTQDISNAFALRYFSIRAYKFLRETLHYPLPALSTLRRWASRITMKTGVLKDILHFMKIKGSELSEMERLTVLQFDEVKVCSLVEYDRMEDQIFGPHSQMQVVMARGLIGKWKQPIYIGFDVKITKALLLQLITELHLISYRVSATVSDCGGSNVGLWRELGITTTNTTFDHPSAPKKQVYVFGDPPHLLKLTRNWLLDTGFILKDGSTVTKAPLVKLRELTSQEISPCFKLTDVHLNCEKTRRQNVRLASELLSHTVGTSLLFYRLECDPKEQTATAEFILKMNKWFDVMNSYSPVGSVPTKRAFGIHREEQEKCLRDVIDTMETMLCITKSGLQTFQKAIILTSKSLIGLFKSLKSEYPELKFLLTHRINQDSLENFFSQLRTRGGLDDHPTPLNALHRIRLILLGKNAGVIQDNTNSLKAAKDNEGDEFITASFLAKAEIAPQHIEPPNDFSDELPSDSDSTSSSSTSQPSVTEEDGVSYLAGWIAKKFKIKHPELGSYTGDKESEHSYATPLSWLRFLSYGGLTEPSSDWLRDVQKMNAIFLKYNKRHSFSKSTGLKRKLTNIVLREKIVDRDREVVEAFFKMRIFIRIKYLNTKKLVKSSLKRKQTSSCPRKLSNKMKRILN